MGLFVLILSVFNQLNAQENLIESGDFLKDYEVVKSNIDIVNKLSFDEIIGYSENFQKICFHYLTPENKARIWNEKFELLISQEENEEIKKAFQELKDGINFEVFSNSKSLEQFKINGEAWMEKYSELIGFEGIKYVVNTLAYARGGGRVKVVIPTPSGQEQPNVDPTKFKCNCSQSSSFCGSSSLCRPSKCDVILDSCGWFWSYNCDGRCNTM